MNILAGFLSTKLMVGEKLGFPVGCDVGGTVLTANTLDSEKVGLNGKDTIVRPVVETSALSVAAKLPAKIASVS